MHLNRFFRLGRRAAVAWIDDDAPSMGAAIAFYTVFSMAPLLMIVLAVAGAFWGREAVEGQLLGQLSGVLGSTGAAAVEGVISNSAEETEQGFAATLFSIGFLLVGSTTMFAELQGAMDRVWKVPMAERKTGIWNVLRARLLSFGLVLGLAFLLLVSLVVSAVLAAIGRWASGLLPAWEVMLQFVNIAFSFGISTLLFAMIFKFMPQTRVAWRDVIVGALVTALLFEMGKFLIGTYVGKSSVASTYAAAGSLVVVLLWVYYAALVFLLGAEFTWAYADEHAERVQPTHDDAKDPPAEDGPAGSLVEREPAPRPSHRPRDT
ncbi:YihY/virulence factor BrkB family protein [Achromobacter sp. GG226]|uniref:YihY/virulence factor BrkB family protein n=1 Tax=Verticiella alkaliphila TaxID=2779529 RepID=UPI001C0B52BF|nr:YihY/virulence factor BrkB family protein [Verticiella sp. GG226]MBU4611939.1 YihY/virulence factor BrkB family protein [Verticiella sp. GG226]